MILGIYVCNATCDKYFTMASSLELNLILSALHPLSII